MKFTIGSDPELFLVDADGKFISAVGLCKGTKNAPFEFLKGFKIHNDNVAVEFNIPPASSKEEFINNHIIALKYCRDVAKEHGYKLRIVSDAEFTDDQLNTREAQEFGCNPDFNAWTLEENPSPQAENTRLRSAGGHIHIGFDGDLRAKLQLVRLLDIFVGVPLRMLEPDSRRNQLYGNLGACRDKEYGVEYRTPSNVWLRSTRLMGDVFTMVSNVLLNQHIYGQVAATIDDNIDRFLQDKPFQLMQSAKALEAHNQFYMPELHQNVLY